MTRVLRPTRGVSSIFERGVKKPARSAGFKPNVVLIYKLNQKEINADRANSPNFETVVSLKKQSVIFDISKNSLDSKKGR